MFDWFSIKAIAVLFCSLLFGGMISITFFIIPFLRRRLKREVARDLLSRLFPAYYFYNTGLSIAAGMATALTGNRHEAVALAILGATFIFARTHLLKAIRAFQPAVGSDEPVSTRFKLIHGFSILLNLAQIAVSGYLLARLAA